tara:strand:- start:89 stop:1018 length:930 start_codon:yes stop_codon:yes gene_type:complete
MSISQIKKIILEDKKYIVSIVMLITILSIIYCYFIATPYFKSESSFYQKKTGGSFSGMNPAVGKLFEKQLGLGSNDKNFNIFIPDLIYKSDKIINAILNEKFPSSFSNEPLTLTEFWNLDKIEDINEQKFLLKEKLRKSINIGINDESQLITISCETEDSIISQMILNSLINEIKNFIIKSTSEHYKDLKNNISKKVDKYDSDLNKAYDDLLNHLNKYKVTEQSNDVIIEEKKLNDVVFMKRGLSQSQQIDYEKADNLEQDNTETLLMIQEPTRPIEQSWPKNILIIALSFISSLFGTIYFLVLKRKFG